MPRTQHPLRLPSDEVKEEDTKTELVVMPSLPEDIIVDILCLLPVKSILRFRCVSKHWCNNLLKDSSFAKTHLDEPVVEIDSPLTLLSGFSKIPENECDLIYGSLNGLILPRNPWESNALILWNPSTKEIKEIPGSVNVGSDSFRHYYSVYSGSDSDFGYDSEGYYNYDWHHAMYTACGFGYSHIIDDYIIVVTNTTYSCSNRICCGCERGEVKVYSFRSNSWITIPDTIPYDLHLGGKIVKPVVLNGDPHWLGTSLTKGHESSKANCIVIVSFDVKHNIFKEVPVIQELQESLFDHVKFSFKDEHAYLSRDILLGNFNGCLSIVQGGELDMSKNNDDEISIWVMLEYGLRESWTKMFCIPKQLIERSINYSKMTVKDIRNGMIMFGKDNSSLVIYDLKHEIARVVNNLSEDWLYVYMYVESLVSLNSGVYLGQRELIDRPVFSGGVWVDLGQRELIEGLTSSDEDLPFSLL
ncbi:F-box protein CPR1-like [Papaver somniferum]|uniref:F-box protein CPR1-like n=1 Tax=Papaver somniferum TaxID=3469 RepID=UPI000E6FA5DB|nr:F-box protein CPR1-like [Papaver somniferum]